MDADFTGEIILVTGAGGGIGAAVAGRLARAGGAIGFIERDAAAAAQCRTVLLAMGAACHGCVGDATDPALVAGAVAAITDALGPVSVLVNNIAHCGPPTLGQTDLPAWRADFAGTVDIPFILCKAVLPAMLAARRGVIVNIGSVNAMLAVGNPAYSAAKAALLSLTQSLATEYGSQGIRANMVSPGTVMTDSPTWQRRLAHDSGVFEQIRAWYPVGRVGKPDDIAAAVAFLAARENSFVNGANLVVDGGLTAGLARMARELVPEAP